MEQLLGILKLSLSDTSNTARNGGICVPASKGLASHPFFFKGAYSPSRTFGLT
jgi:hypothetical protein